MDEVRRSIPAPAGPLPVVVVSPSDEAVLPGIVVIQEWWGLNEQILGVARRLAAEGFAAVVPDLYRGARADEPDEARKLSMAHSQGESVTDLHAVVAWLAEREVPGIGVMGFCMGGGIAWELALTEGRVDAAVVYYGGVEFEGRTLAIPVLAHYGTKDRFPVEMYEAIRRAMEAIPGSELHLYEGAGHAFSNEEGDRFDPEAAALAWDRTVGFFQRTLGSG